MARQISARVEFDGSQDYIDITWAEVYAERRYMRSVSVANGDPIVDVNFTIDDGTTLRVEPTARFVGFVDVVNIEVLP